jgi:hypothetical protein
MNKGSANTMNSTLALPSCLRRELLIRESNFLNVCSQLLRSPEHQSLDLAREER